MITSKMINTRIEIYLIILFGLTNIEGRLELHLYLTGEEWITLDPCSFNKIGYIETVRLYHKNEQQSDRCQCKLLNTDHVTGRIYMNKKDDQNTDNYGFDTSNRTIIIMNYKRGEGDFGRIELNTLSSVVYETWIQKDVYVDVTISSDGGNARFTLDCWPPPTTTTTTTTTKPSTTASTSSTTTTTTKNTTLRGKPAPVSSTKKPQSPVNSQSITTLLNTTIPSTTNEGTSPLPIVLIAIAGLLGSVVLIIIAVCCVCSKRKSKSSEEPKIAGNIGNGGLQEEVVDENAPIEYAEINMNLLAPRPKQDPSAQQEEEDEDSPALMYADIGFNFEPGQAAGQATITQDAVAQRNEDEIAAMYSVPVKRDKRKSKGKENDEDKVGENSQDT